ncbi:MAG: SDR family NAD(P)-dependent oxidoreductase [Bacilli bacterium]|nr:SDR family NAD(P)-dependent oxidoreductase [Bacilli bacterium]
MRGLKNKTAIITGAAAARSIGRATAKRFAEEGVNLVLNDINSENLKEVIKEINNIGGKAVAVVGDISESSTSDELVKAAIENFGTYDILVNNAGITESISLDELTEDKWDKVLKTNLKSVYLLSRAALKHMKDKGQGRIINVSSISGRGGGSFGSSHYAASKAGIIGFTRAVAKEVAPFGITVNAIAPASIDTNILSDKPSKDGKSPEEVMAGRISRTPLGRLASADEVASVITFLASDDSSFMTGVVLDINGGVFMG